MRFVSYPKIETEIDVYILLHMCRNPIFLAYITLSGSIVAFGNPVSRHAIDTLADWMIFISISSLSFVLFFATFSAFRLSLVAHVRREVVHVTPIIAVTAIFTQIVADFTGGYLVGYSGTNPSVILGSMAFIILISIVSSSIYFGYVHNFVMRSYIEPEFPADYVALQTAGVSLPNIPESKNEIITIGGSKYPTAGILYIKADRNYVKIAWENGAAFLRARLSDVVEQLPDSRGIQVHRSIWISKTAIIKASVTNSELILKTKDDIQHRVARHRKHEVQEWLRFNGILY